MRLRHRVGYPYPTPRRTVRTMGDTENDDEIAAENWDDEGGHLLTLRGSGLGAPGRGEHFKPIDGDRQRGGDEVAREYGAGVSGTGPIPSPPQSHSPRQIAHFPPL